MRVQSLHFWPNPDADRTRFEPKNRHRRNEKNKKLGSVSLGDSGEFGWPD